MPMITRARRQARTKGRLSKRRLGKVLRRRRRVARR